MSAFHHVATLLMLVATTACAEAHAANWILANEYFSSTLPARGDDYFARLVQERTGGRLRFTLYYGGTLGYKSRDQLQAVATGKITMADSFAGALGDAEPVFLLSSLPLLTPSVADARRLFDVARPSYERAFARHNQKLLFASPWPAAGIWARQPATSMPALRALAIRTYDETSAEVLNGVGAQAVNLSFNEVSDKLKAGDINAVLSSGDGGVGRNLWEYLGCFTEINYAIPLSLVTVNLNAWNALDPETQDIVQKAADETMAHQWQEMEGRVAQNYKRMRENAMTIVTEVPDVVREALARASAIAIEDWAKKTGDEGRMLLEKFRAGKAEGKQ